MLEFYNSYEARCRRCLLVLPSYIHAIGSFAPSRGWRSSSGSHYCQMSAVTRREDRPQPIPSRLRQASHAMQVTPPIHSQGLIRRNSNYHQGRCHVPLRANCGRSAACWVWALSKKTTTTASSNMWGICKRLRRYI